jgi:hypothetical protein
MGTGRGVKISAWRDLAAELPGNPGNRYKHDGGEAVYLRAMRMPPAIDLPESGTPAEHLDGASRKVLSIPREVPLREEAKELHQREKRRAGKKAH